MNGASITPATLAPGRINRRDVRRTVEAILPRPGLKVNGEGCPMSEPFAVFHTHCTNCGAPLDRPVVYEDFCDETCAAEFLEEYDPEAERVNQEVAGFRKDRE